MDKEAKSVREIIDRAISYIERANYVGEFEYSARLDLIQDLEAVKHTITFLAKQIQKEADPKGNFKWQSPYSQKEQE